MPTIKDVAKLAGVSIATVSNVINHNGNVAQETQTKVLEAIKTLHYIPNYVARSKKTQLVNSIGVIAELLTSALSASIISGISAYCDQNQYSLTLSNMHIGSLIDYTKDFRYEPLKSNEKFLQKLERSLRCVQDNSIRGLIYIGAHPRDVSGLLAHLPIPVVNVLCCAKDSSYNLLTDDVQGARLATEHLISLGHQKIALISGPLNSISAHRRLQGYQSALMDHSLTLYPEYIRTGAWLYEDGYDACRALFSLPEPPTAIFAMNDMMGIGAVNYAHDHGIPVPGKLSVIGFDNHEASMYAYPPLSSIDPQLREMGFSAAQLLINQLSGAGSESTKKPEDILICCKLLTRATTGPYT